MRIIMAHNIYSKPKVTLHLELPYIYIFTVFDFNQIKYYNELLVPALT